ncbi:Nucleotide-diphospho-sugar transferase domain-containing protein [Madurella fahalii]|uniref:Nucleotide-diphospho-sugar transferase domain-containing protein n=1 Tax=Madurella fahalii TaxID=1157608 RepID=A0ABQ0G4E5_9PEZI
MALPFGTQRILAFCIPTVLVLIFIVSAFRAGSITAPIQAIKGGASSTHEKERPPLPHGFSDLIFELYKPIKLPVTAKSYTDQRGNKFDNGGREFWTTSMGRDILVVDIDTRNPNGKNELFNPDKIDWETVRASGSGLLTVSHINHFIYSQIHGYDYKFFHARKMKGHWNTWIKPHALQEVLRYYKFVVFIDADAIIQHLEVPIEFLFNRWNISQNTSIAMPIDTQQIREGEGNISTDSKGKVVLNSGVVVLQNLPHTHDMMQAWTECTSETRYPGCAQWKDRWSHEQRAFSEYIRYDFNPDGNNIVEIPCNDANGYPGLFGKADVVDDCKGEFVRHYTLDKEMAKSSTGDVLMQSMAELLQRNYAENHKNILIEEL